MINKNVLDKSIPQELYSSELSPLEINNLIDKLKEQARTVRSSLAVVEGLVLEQIFDEWHTRDESNYQKALKDQLNKINAALQRYNQGSYGLCINCGKQVAKQQLILEPTTELCNDCS